MKIKTVAAAAAVVLSPLALGACALSDQQAQIEQLQAENQQLKAALAQSKAEQDFVEKADLLFPSGGFQLSPAGQSELATNIAPKLRNLQNAKVVVYGYTDNLPVGAPLKRAGIENNIDLSSRRADNVVAYMTSQGVDPNIISAKGFGDTHPVAGNDTRDGRAKNRRIEIVLEGPGA